MMQHDNDKTKKDGEQGRDSAGVLIRRAREQAGLSREQLATRVNLLSNQILVLENDRYDSLPSAMFVRAYLRAIARELTLNEAELLAAWQQVAPSAPAVSGKAAIASAGTMRPISLGRASSVRKHWGLVAAALVVASLWGWQQHEHEDNRALSLTTNVVEGESAALGGIEDALNSNGATRLMDSVELLPVMKPETATATAEQQAVVPTNGDQAIAQQQLASGNTQMVTATGDQLSLRFSADCWVEIKDRDNRVLVASLKHANEKLQLEGRGPFRVLLGFAPGVEMAYNGTPVNIEVSQGSRSTRLIVGSS